MSTPRELKALFEQGSNISGHLRQQEAVLRNTEEIIEVAYDLQAGSYIAAMKDATTSKYQNDYTGELGRTIRSLCRPASILEAGVGEATTLSGVLGHLGFPLSSHGFDLTWSRVAYAKRWLHQQGISGTTLCTGSLLHIPFSDSSIDVVYTSHSIEPNGGNEEAIIRELFRVTRQFLILLEPAYELAGEEAKQRMVLHGYCRNLLGTALDLGCEVLEHKLFPFASNPLNPTGITVIRKGGAMRTAPSDPLACPKFKTSLQEIGGVLFSPEALVVYPIVGGIPCLRIENAILASKYPEVVAKS